MKKKSGITLIALIITIIVLLILAGVTISMVVGDNGVLTRAKDSSEKTLDGQEDERVKLAVSDALSKGMGSLTTADLKEAIGKEFGEDKKEKLTGEGPWVYEGERKTYTIDGAGNLGEQKPKTIEDLKVGEWIEYNSSAGNIKCRVLYDTSYNEKNNTNYGVQIIANENVSNVTLGYDDESAEADPSYSTSSNDKLLKAVDSYNNSVEKLTKLAKEYKNSTTNYVENVRCVGSKPDFTSDTPRYENHTPWDESDCVYNGGPFRVEDENYITDYEQLKTIDNGEFLNNSNDFWMASCATNTFNRNYVIKTGYGMVRFWNQSYANKFDSWKKAWAEDHDSYDCMFFLLCDEEFGSSYEKGLRPVFKLKPGTAISGSGTQDDCYTFEN